PGGRCPPARRLGRMGAPRAAGAAGRPDIGRNPLMTPSIVNGGAAGRPDLGALDFEQSPFLVIWEVTRACDLACKHCRAEAVTNRNPLELSTEQGKRLMDDVRRFGRPLFVLTGGDPLKRPDVVELVEYGASIGLRMAMTPSGTPLMTESVLRELREDRKSVVEGESGDLGGRRIIEKTA